MPHFHIPLFFCSRCSLERRKTFAFSSRHYTIGLRNTRHFFIQSEVKPNQSQLIRTHFPALHVRWKNLPRKMIGSLDCRVHCDWPGQNDYFGFGFTKTALTKRVLTNPRFYHISLPVELQESWVVIQLRFSIGRHSLQLLQFALYKKKKTSNFNKVLF